MNILLFCLQEHGAGGESSERNDVDWKYSAKQVAEH